MMQQEPRWLSRMIRTAKAGLQHMGCKVNILVIRAILVLHSLELNDLNCFFWGVHAFVMLASKP